MSLNQDLPPGSLLLELSQCSGSPNAVWTLSLAEPPPTPLSSSFKSIKPILYTTPLVKKEISPNIEQIFCLGCSSYRLFQFYLSGPCIYITNKSLQLLPLRLCSFSWRAISLTSLPATPLQDFRQLSHFFWTPFSLPLWSVCYPDKAGGLMSHSRKPLSTTKSDWEETEIFNEVIWKPQRVHFLTHIKTWNSHFSLFLYFSWLPLLSFISLYLNSNAVPQVSPVKGS